MDIGLKIRRNTNFHYIRVRPTEELTQAYYLDYHVKIKVKRGPFTLDYHKLFFRKKKMFRKNRSNCHGKKNCKKKSPV